MEIFKDAEALLSEAYRKEIQNRTTSFISVAPPASAIPYPPAIQTAGSMTAEEFFKLPPDKQRDTLVKAFEHRMERAKNVSFELERSDRWFYNNNGEPSEPYTDYTGYSGRWQYWRLGDSFRFDNNRYGKSRKNDADFESRYSHAVQAQEGIARVRSLYPNNKQQNLGQVNFYSESNLTSDL